MDKPRRVLLIALDAAEPELVERWTADGSLPNLRKLRKIGVYGRLASSAKWLTGSPWPTFFTGRSPADHGVYQFLQWRADEMQARRPTADWLPVQPFWREFGRHGRRAITLDIPQTYSPEPFNGIEITGWASHDTLAPPGAYPAAIMDWVRREIGPSPLGPETHRLQAPSELLSLRDGLRTAAERVGTLAQRLMIEHAWDFFAVSFGAVHRAGHKLWDLSCVAGAPSEDEAHALGSALKDVYVECDRAIGRLVETAGPDATLLVCSLHGMGPNTSRVPILATMLARILSGCPVDTPQSMLRGIRQALPSVWRSELKSKLPLAVQDRLTSFWRVHGVNWQTTQAHALTADQHGYIRVNCAGREAKGVVEPGLPFDSLCQRIIVGLHSFVDEDTGDPVVTEVGRSEQLYPNGCRRHLLPDLIVRWAESPASRHRAVRSPHFGRIGWPLPGKHPDARSGNHRPEGFLLAVGPSLPNKGRLPTADIIDLAPTIRSLLHLPPEPELAGLPVAALQQAA
jgi:predicted AlkP superfamily phosphohydrolase/phosphomutase